MSLVALSLQEQASSDRKQGYGGKKTVTSVPLEVLRLGWGQRSIVFAENLSALGCWTVWKTASQT